MITFEVLRNRVLVGEVKAVSLRQAVLTARRTFGRCEVIAPRIARNADRFHDADSHRTEGRGPCNATSEGKARIEAIRQAAIAKWKAEQSA